jgi:hypothetical protein
MKETPLQSIIESFERARASVKNEDIIKGIDFALTIVRAYEPVIERQLEIAKIQGSNEALKDVNERFSKEQA